MNDLVMRYKGYVIDFTPIEAVDGSFAPRWTIAKDDAVWTASVPRSAGMLAYRGTREQATEMGRLQGMRKVDHELTLF